MNPGLAYFLPSMLRYFLYLIASPPQLPYIGIPSRTFPPRYTPLLPPAHGKRKRKPKMFSLLKLSLRKTLACPLSKHLLLTMSKPVLFLLEWNHAWYLAAFLILCVAFPGTIAAQTGVTTHTGNLARRRHLSHRSPRQLERHAVSLQPRFCQPRRRQSCKRHRRPGDAHLHAFERLCAGRVVLRHHRVAIHEAIPDPVAVLDLSLNWWARPSAPSPGDILLAAWSPQALSSAIPAGLTPLFPCVEFFPAALPHGTPRSTLASRSKPCH